VTAFSVEAGAQTLSVTDNSPGRAVMPKIVTVPSPNSEAIRISPPEGWAIPTSER
jgi:hypothetical protein